MSEIRRDPITGRWVIIRYDNVKKPDEVYKRDIAVNAEKCPYCEGNEVVTPPEILAYRRKGTDINGAGWWIRVVTAEDAALKLSEEQTKTCEDIYDCMSAVGSDEILVESPEHRDVFTENSAMIKEVLWAYRDRTIELKKDKRVKYVLIYKNIETANGKFVSHPVSKIIALPIIPKVVNEELKGAREYYEYKDRCVFCDVIKQETETDERVVCSNKDFVSFMPFASRFAFETWVAPSSHSWELEKTTNEEMSSLSEILLETMKRLKYSLDGPSYSMIIHMNPGADGEEDYYHFHIEIIPKLFRSAGFEWGSGFYINHVPPENAAKYMKNLKLEVYEDAGKS